MNNMVGIVIVSHSQRVAESVAELAKMMASSAPVAAGGGLEDGTFGTSFERISNAIDAVYSDDGAIILMDMGSAVMTTEMVLESMPERKLKMADAPLVEGAIVAAIGSISGDPLKEIVASAERTREEKKLG